MRCAQREARRGGPGAGKAAEARRARRTLLSLEAQDADVGHICTREQSDQPRKNLQSQKRVAGPIDGMDQMVSAPNSPDSFFSDSGVTTNGGIFCVFCGFITNI